MSNVINPEFELRASDDYIALKEECQSILTEKFVIAQSEWIGAKWEVGKLIFEDNHRMKREAIYGKKVIETLADDLNVSASNLWLMI